MISSEIKDFREKHNLDQQQLADILGVKVGTVQSWEQGKRNITQSSIKLLLQYEKEKEKNQTGSVEEVIAKKVLNEVGPLLGEFRDQVLRAIMALNLDLDKIQKNQEDLQSQQKETHQVVESIEKKK